MNDTRTLPWDMFVVSKKLQNETWEKEPTDFDGIIKEFNSFPWEEQVEVASSLHIRFPTMTIKDPEVNREIWIYPGINTEFAMGYSYLRLKKSLWGFGKEKVDTFWQEYDVPDTDTLTQLIRHFYNRDHNAIKSILSTLKEF